MNRSRPPLRPRRPRGFTLIELMIVVALAAVAAGLMSLALRDTAESRLEEEAARLAALFDSARAAARMADADIRWQPVPAENDTAASFRFTGLPPGVAMPSRWLREGVSAQVVGAPFVRLGPEPIIGEQHVILSLGERHVELATDGLGPFERVASSNTGSGNPP